MVRIVFSENALAKVATPWVNHFLLYIHWNLLELELGTFIQGITRAGFLPPAGFGVDAGAGVGAGSEWLGAGFGVGLCSAAGGVPAVAGAGAEAGAEAGAGAGVIFLAGGVCPVA